MAELRNKHVGCRGIVPVMTLMSTLLTIPLFAEVSQRAFPGAEGFGAYAIGGRGGDVYHVNNLNDFGPGSLRDAIDSANGPRTVVFDISGYISLQSPLIVDKSHITIAGQTAPGGGITLQDHTLAIANTNDVIVRHLRSRVGDSVTSFEGRDAFEIYNSTDVIFDHLSASWDSDEALSVTGASDRITVQWSIMSESLTSRILPSGQVFGQGAGGLIVVGDGGVTYHHNLYAHNRKRNPYVSSFAGHDGVTLDFVNNVIYDWGVLASHGGEGLTPNPTPPKAFINLASNYYKPGPSTDPGHNDEIYFVTQNQEDYIYLEGNYLSTHPTWIIDSQQDNMIQGHAWTQLSSPLSVPEVAMDSYLTAYNRVLEEAGASLARDAVDKRIVDDVVNGTGGLIHSQVEVGGWPTLLSLAPLVDTDRDGMPNVWEYTHGINPFDPSDRNDDRIGDGYTNLEEYLHWLTLGLSLPAPLAGDFNVDGRLSAVDIDDLYTQVRIGVYNPSYDLTGDAAVDQSDVSQWVQNSDFAATTFADFNLDRRVNNADANTLRASLGTVAGASWATGDTNGDGRVNNTDANRLRANLGFDNTGVSITDGSLSLLPTTPSEEVINAHFTYNDLTGELFIEPGDEQVWATTFNFNGEIVVIDTHEPTNWVFNQFPDAIEFTDLGLGSDPLIGDAVILLLRLQGGLSEENFGAVEYFIASDFDIHLGEISVIPEPTTVWLLCIGGILLIHRAQHFTNKE